MSDDLAYQRRVHTAKRILNDPDHPFARRLADELDSWADLDSLADDDANPHGIPRPLATLPNWGLPRRPTRLLQGKLP